MLLPAFPASSLREGSDGVSGLAVEPSLARSLLAMSENSPQSPQTFAHVPCAKMIQRERVLGTLA